MLHGLLTGSVASWFFTCAPALARDRAVFLFDQRGHGRSELTFDGYSSASQADDLALLTKDLPPFVLVGHSFGALIAARFALSAPDRILGLALIEPPIGTRLPLPVAPGDTFDEERWLVGAGTDPTAIPPRARARIRALLAQTTLRSDLAMEPAFDEDDVARLPAPLLIVLGARSPTSTLAPHVRQAAPHARVELIDAGHAVHVDATAELTKLLSSFMHGCDRRLHDPPGPPDDESGVAVAYG
jgi:pimeloyl-ACP methyl ester carboxylesterase